MTITLRPIDTTNWQECIGLQVDESQKSFVAPNVYSLAQAKIFPSCIPMAIYKDEKMVGFTMYGKDQDAGKYYGKYWVIRLMIDRNYQKKGYGKTAILRIIDLLKTNMDCDSVILSHNPENTVADRLYSSLGFRNTGDIIDGETVKCLDITR